jgi:chromate transport protein ChrA
MGTLEQTPGAAGPAVAAAVGSGYGPAIGCFVVLFAFISPRLALFALWLFSDLLSRAFDSPVVPFLGFFLLPWTTLAYAAMWSSSDRVSGFEWFIVVLAFAIDLGAYANRDRARRASA